MSISTDGDQDRALVNGWLRTLGARAGLALQLNTEGVCAVGHASGLDCAIEVPDGAGTVYLRAPLLPWLSGPASTLQGEYCLNANFLGLRTGGASFAIDPRSRELVLWKACSMAALDEASFCEVLLQFLETAAKWREELYNPDSAAAQGRSDSSSTGAAISTGLV